MHKHNRADANKQSYSALHRPDNGCRVWGVKSNETDREQQLSVCGNGGWKGSEKGGGGGGESRHKCPCQDQTREGLTTTTSPKWHQSQLQEKRCRCLITENRHRHSSLLDWCELMRDPPDGQEGRAGLKKARVS